MALPYHKELLIMGTILNRRFAVVCLLIALAMKLLLLCEPVYSAMPWLIKPFKVFRIFAVIVFMIIFYKQTT